MSGYTATVRPPVSYTTPLKVQQIKEYNYTDLNLQDYEEDHFVALEIGGHPTDPRNLWPEPYSPVPNSHEKDRVENELHRLVCSGQITLSDAQNAIKMDWIAVYAKMKP